MGKTERILSYLPPTFQAYPRPSVLFSVVDAVGQRLLEADNLLFEVMRAHWVDFADQEQEEIHDLAKLAALFALAPRDDEDVETFRTHLKSYVRTYLEGSATVPGVLRLAASTLALSIEEELEPGPDDPPYVAETIHPGQDAATKLFGFEAVEVSGEPPAPARVVGKPNLEGSVDLSGGDVLELAVDGDKLAAVTISSGEQQAVDLWEIARQINAELGAPVATHDAHSLTLVSEVAGPTGEIQLGSPADDAADALLGVAPNVYRGTEDQPAQVVGAVDHAPSGGVPLVDLSQARYLRLALDRGQPQEVDCAGADPAATTLDEVRDRINDTFQAPVASHDGHVLTVASPNPGSESRLEILPAPAQDARKVLLGPAVPRVNRGRGAAAAQLVGRADLHLGVDLSQRNFLRIRLDGADDQEIDCAGDQPDATALPEIAARINGTFAAEVATEDGRLLTLTSPTVGADSRIEVLKPSDPETDATELILGVAPRVYTGSPPGPARLEGLVTLEEPLDLRRQRILWLSIDGGQTLAIDCAGADRAHTLLQEIVDAINDAAGTTVAFHQDDRLILQSPTEGATSALVVRAPETTTRRFFYTRGRVREDAATWLFGFAAGEALGRLPEPARLTGDVDLSRGADLRVAHTLRLQVDDREPLDIRIADPARPLVTLLPHIVERINAELGGPVASERDGRLMLISPTEGPQGRIALGTSTASDAGPVLFGLPPGSQAQGRAAEQVQFVGMGDLARGLDVTDTYQLLVGIDNRPVTSIDLRDALRPGGPPIVSPAQIAASLNQALGGTYADQDSRHIILASKETGSASKVRIELAAEHDATPAVFGLSEGRSYEGQDATSARLVGEVDLGDGVDLDVRRHLSLEIDGRLVADVDCAGKDEGPTSPASLIARINAAAGQPVAGQVDGRLVIVSPTSGSASSVVLRASSAADARQKVLGGAPTVAIGQPAQPAVLEGKSKLNRPVDLGARSIIRLQVDDGQVQDIDCRGEDPTSTFPDEAVDRINAVFPGLASLEEERRLVLRAEHRVALLSLRCFTLFEFPPVPSRSAGQAVQHGTTWSVRNSSVRDEPAEWVLTSHTGVDRPRLTRRDTGNWVQVNAVIPGGFTLHVRPTDEDGLEAWMEAPGRASHNLSSALEAQPGPEALCLPVGESRWLYNDCFGDRFDAAYFGHRPRRGRRPRQEIVPGHFAGGEVCHSPGTFNLSRFYDAAQPGTETVFGSRQAEIATQATSAFVYLTHQAARFELRLPRDLPPQLGGRFNTARFAGEGTLYGAAIFDLPEDPRALDEQVKARPAMVTAHVALVADEQVPIYDVPFNTDRPLVGGSHDRYARAYLRQPGVPGLVELRAKEPGEWGNLILITAPDAETPGAYDITATYTGQDVFENARQKVAEQVAYARAAGIMAEVTRR